MASGIKVMKIILPETVINHNISTFSWMSKSSFSERMHCKKGIVLRKTAILHSVTRTFSVTMWFTQKLNWLIIYQYCAFIGKPIQRCPLCLFVVFVFWLSETEVKQPIVGRGKGAIKLAMGWWVPTSMRVCCATFGEFS